MNTGNTLDSRVIACTARHLAAVNFTHPGSAPARATTLIDSMYVRAQTRAERRIRKTATAA